MVNLTPSHPSWKRRMFAPLWTFHDPLKMSKGVPSVRCQPLGPLGGIPTGASEPQPWGGKLGGGVLSVPPSAWGLGALHQLALCSLPKSSLQMVKVETKWKRSCSEFSLDQAAGLSSSFCASFLRHRPFCFQECASERPLGIKLSESVSGWCPFLIILGHVPAFIFSLCPLKIWALRKAWHTAGLQLSSPFLPPASSNNTIINDPDFKSPLFSYTISHFQLYRLRIFAIHFPNLLKSLLDST